MSIKKPILLASLGLLTLSGFAFSHSAYAQAPKPAPTAASKDAQKDLSGARHDTAVLRDLQAQRKQLLAQRLADETKIRALAKDNHADRLHRTGEPGDRTEGASLQADLRQVNTELGKVDSQIKTLRAGYMGSISDYHTDQHQQKK